MDQYGRSISGSHARTPQTPLPLDTKVPPGDLQRQKQLAARFQMVAKPPWGLKGFLALSKNLERTGRDKKCAILSIEFQVLHKLLIQNRCHAHLCRFVAANPQHLCGRISPLNGKPIPQKRHQEAARPTSNFQGDPAIATKALVEKG